ncbi:unnamed protein product [Aureobasidium pullulans]|nr:unnamed protein product [Aureobasidium pullulans]
MHISAIPRRRPVPPFANHTPRAFEFQKTGKLHQTSAMFGPTGMAVPVMLPAGPAPSAKPAKPDVSASERSSTGGSVSYASSRADVKSQDESRPTSSELVAGEDSRNPFVDRMMTQTNLLVLPPSNPSYQMAYFLKTTGPVKEPPVKGARSKRISSAMRIFKGSSRRPSESLTAAHMRLNEVISEEKEELELETQATEKASHTSRKPLISPEPRLPEVVVPKISKTGALKSKSKSKSKSETRDMGHGTDQYCRQRYFEIEPVRAQKEKQGSASKNPQIAESRVSVLVTDQLSTDSLHDWVLGFEGAKTDTKPQEHEGPEALRGWPIKRISQTLPHEETIRVLDRKIVAPHRSRTHHVADFAEPDLKDLVRLTSAARTYKAPLNAIRG